MLALAVLAMIAASACAHGSAADSSRSVNCPTKVPGKAGEGASGTSDETSTDIAVELNGRDITIDGTLIDVLPIAGNLYALPKLVRFLDKRWGDRSPIEHPGSLVLKISSSASVAQVHAVVTTAVFAGYPNIEVQTGGAVRRFRRPYPGPSSSPKAKLEPGESVYVSKTASGFELTWLRWPDGAKKPDVVGKSKAASGGDELRRVLRAQCSDALPCSNVVIEIEKSRPFAEVVSILAAFDQVSTHERGPVLAFGEWPRAGDGTPKVVVGPRPKSGMFRPGQVEKVLSSHRSDVRNCYLEGIARDPTLAGNVTVEILIDTNGKVRNVSVTDKATLNDQVAVDCVKRVFESMTFPPPFGGDATVTVPMSFQVAPPGPK